MQSTTQPRKYSIEFMFRTSSASKGKKKKKKDSAGVVPVRRDQVTDYLRKSLVFNLIKTI